MNLSIYKQDIKNKGWYWSFIARLYKLPGARGLFSPLVNFFKPNFVIFAGNKIFIDKNDEVVSQRLIENKNWDAFETKIFCQSLKVGDVVVDVGAHIGFYTLLAAKIVGEAGKVYAFEPDSKNFSLLTKNVAANGYKNVILVNKAVSNKTGQAKLFIHPENTGDHRLYSAGDSRVSKTIETVSLDDYFANSSEKIDFIKLDIQGFEYQALSGSKKTISKQKNLKMITEFWPYGLAKSGDSANKLLSLLKELGFKLFIIPELGKKLVQVRAKGLRLILREGERESFEHTDLLCVKKIK